MKTNYISEIIERFFEKTYSADTNREVQQWLIKEEYEDQKEKALRKAWERAGNCKIDDNDRKFLILDKVRNELELGNSNYRLRKIQLNFLKIASVIVLVLSLTGGFYLYRTDKSVEYVAKNGEIKNIELPDGSNVLLNSGSELIYNKREWNKKRTVKLTGEAFFIVSRDSLRPFIVETNTIETEVLGTEFNIEDYPENFKAIATLNSGKIKVRISDKDNNSEFHTLEPNQQFVYNRSSDIEIRSVKADEIRSWKDGKLIFNNASLKEIVNKLERHFNLKISIHDISKYHDYYDMKFVNGENIEQIMTIMRKTIGDFSYEIAKQ